MASAQFPEPKLAGLSTTGGRAGDSVLLTISGTDLEGANSLWFDHPGFRAFLLKGATFRVAIGPDVPPGHHDIRASGPLGISNPRVFVVGDRPEALEVEPNETKATATPLTPNSTVSGVIATPTELDFYAFEGVKGRRLFLDLAAERLDSKLDATLTLYGPDGRAMAESRDVRGVDPFLDVTLPADGRYTLRVHDVVYGGSPQHVYRLTIHEGPHVDAAIPRALEPGKTTKVTFYGRGLGGKNSPGLTADGMPLEQVEVDVTIPADDLSWPGQVAGAGLLRRGADYVYANGSGRAEPIGFALANVPVTLEVEPNDETKPQTLTLPAEVSGTFGEPSDLDVYRFKAKKGEVYWIEATAEKIGSSADPVFVVQQVDDKGVATDLVVGDDLADAGTAPRALLSSVDPAIRWEAPADGTFQVAISDLLGSQRGDARLAYVLSIRPARADYQLMIAPENLALASALTVRAGGKASARILVARVDGFSRPIRVEAVDLPAGLKCDPTVIAAGQVQAPIVVEADPTAKEGIVTLKLVGRSLNADGKADPSEVVMPAMGVGLIAVDVPSKSRRTRGFPLTVIGGAPFAVAWSADTLIAAPGRRLDFKANVTRLPGFVEAVALASVDVPPGVPALALTIAKDQGSATGSLLLPKTVTPGVYALMARGSGPFPFSKDPAAKEKPNVTVSEPTNILLLDVRAAPATMAAVMPPGPLARGSKLEIPLTITRVVKDCGPVTVRLIAEADMKLSAEVVAIAADQGAGKLTILAGADAPEGPKAVLLRISATVDGQVIETDEPLTLTVAPKS
ncbi:PPC domain-containing protein [Isosphaeraceae bacterium EP7]